MRGQLSSHFYVGHQLYFYWLADEAALTHLSKFDKVMCSPWGLSRQQDQKDTEFRKPARSAWGLPLACSWTCTGASGQDGAGHGEPWEQRPGVRGSPPARLLGREGSRPP